MNASKVKILVVDDDEDDFIITREMISDIPGTEWQIDWCFRYGEALDFMIQKKYDLYFVDYRLGAKSGVDLLKEAHKNNCTEPIILLTGKGNYKVDIEAMQLGAVDYLIKTELSEEKLERSIRYALERTASIKALRANERKYRSIFERSKDMVFVTDENFDFKDINEAAVILLGYTREELLGMNLCDLIEQAQHKKFLQQSLQNRKELDDWDVILTTKSGEHKNCIISAVLDDDYYDFPCVQGIIHDITNLRKAEKATLQAEKLAATGRLVRTLAHEVRNPLNNITLSVEQMQQEPVSPNVELYLNIIQRNSQRISDLISELLNNSRPTDISLEKQNLQQILDEVIATAIDRLTLKRIGLRISYPDEPISIMADKEKLEIALLNIVINAIEAMEEQKGKLDIWVKAGEQEIVLRISDNGCGISEENISRLFEPYFTQKRNGMGLGLVFTLNMIQAHKANVEVQSAPDAGTSFIITFPTPSALLAAAAQASLTD
ncbi:ATP-binding protein [Chitinophagaceae bacterium MMS25-I14]